MQTCYRGRSPETPRAARSCLPLRRVWIDGAKRRRRVSVILSEQSEPKDPFPYATGRKRRGIPRSARNDVVSPVGAILIARKHCVSQPCGNMKAGLPAARAFTQSALRKPTTPQSFLLRKKKTAPLAQGSRTGNARHYGLSVSLEL